MFYVSALLQDDDKRVATEVVLLSVVANISRGSVATHLKCGGISSDNIITNFRLILTVK